MGGILPADQMPSSFWGNRESRDHLPGPSRTINSLPNNNKESRKEDHGKGFSRGEVGSLNAAGILLPYKRMSEVNAGNSCQA